MKFIISEEAREHINGSMEPAGDYALFLYSMLHRGWSGTFKEVRVNLLKKDQVRGIEEFTEVGRYEETGNGALPILMDGESQRLFTGQEEIDIELFGWSEMKFLSIPNAVFPSLGFGGSCSVF